MRDSESCLLEHLAKLDILHGARSTFHQNNPLGSAMNVMDVSIIAAETAFAPKDLNILWLCLCIAYLPNYKTESIRHHLKGAEKWPFGAWRRARSLLDRRGRSGSGEEVTFRFIYSFKANLLSTLLFLLALEMQRHWALPEDDKVDCRRINRQVLKDGEDSDR